MTLYPIIFPPTQTFPTIFPCLLILFQLFPHVCPLPQWLRHISRCGPFLPSCPLSSLSVVPGWYMSSVIPSSWNIGICGHGQKLTDGFSAWEMKPIHQAVKVGSGANQTAHGDLVAHSHFTSPLIEREPLELNQIHMQSTFYLFFLVAGASMINTD